MTEERISELVRKITWKNTQPCESHDAMLELLGAAVDARDKGQVEFVKFAQGAWRAFRSQVRDVVFTLDAGNGPVARPKD